MSVPNTAPPASAAARRLFFAVPVEEPVRTRLEDASHRLQTAARLTPLVATWVPPRNFHLTLYFLGAVEPQLAGRLVAACAEASGPPWVSEKLTARGVGYFPDARSPRVLWTAVQAPSHAIDDWRAGLATVIERAGLVAPTADFHAHLTLARFKGLRGTGLFVKMARQFERTVFGAWWAGAIHLMQSTLGGPEPVYTPIATIPLAPRDTDQRQAKAPDGHPTSAPGLRLDGDGLVASRCGGCDELIGGLPLWPSGEQSRFGIGRGVQRGGARVGHPLRAPVRA